MTALEKSKTNVMLTSSEWRKRGEKLRVFKEKVDTQLTWMLGDWYNNDLSDVLHGYKSKICIEIFGQRMMQQIYNFACLARKWPVEERVEGLSIAMHKELSSVPREQRAGIILMVKNGELPKDTMRQMFRMRRFHSTVHGVKVSALDVRDFLAQIRSDPNSSEMVKAEESEVALLAKLKRRLDCMNDNERVTMLAAFHRLLDENDEDAE